MLDQRKERDDTEPKVGSQNVRAMQPFILLQAVVDDGCYMTD